LRPSSARAWRPSIWSASAPMAARTGPACDRPWRTIPVTPGWSCGWPPTGTGSSAGPRASSTDARTTDRQTVPGTGPRTGGTASGTVPLSHVRGHIEAQRAGPAAIAGHLQACVAVKGGRCARRLLLRCGTAFLRQGAILAHAPPFDAGCVAELEGESGGSKPSTPVKNLSASIRKSPPGMTVPIGLDMKCCPSADSEITQAS
jgi:hypothetical protein